MRKRDVFFMIVIIILVQFIVQAAAYIYYGNGSILDYISFTGTIVSIILAILAIIYSYIQNFTQNKSSVLLSQQTDRLTEAVGQTEIANNVLRERLNDVLKINENMCKSTHLIEKSNTGESLL